MLPTKFSQQTTTYAKDQPKFIPLPAHVDSEDEQGVVTTCWHLSWYERLKLLFTGELWIQQMTYRRSLQAIKPSATNPLN